MSKVNKTKTGLGKGLGALIQSVDFSPEKGFTVGGNEGSITAGMVAEIEISSIRINPYQPRQDFDEEALEGLKKSILRHGVISPITVRKSINGYELIAGERRLRASTAAGLEKIPAFVMDVDTPYEMLELALIENIQRENLNPIETAHGYKRLIEEHNYTQEQLAATIGKDRSTVTNFLRLLKLPDTIQESLRSKEITVGHARALLSLNDVTKIIWAGNEIVEKQLSVRDTENLVKQIESQGSISDKKSQNKKPKEIISSEVKAVLEDRANTLRHAFGTQVRIAPKTKESGTIEFEFYSADDLERLLELFAYIEKRIS